MRRIVYDPPSTKVIKKESFMKRATYFVACLALLGVVMIPILSKAGVTGTAAPQSGANVKHPGEILAKQKNCLACHNVKVKMVGPALKDVAGKYTEADMDYLTGKVMQGSMGVWGQIPMPPNNVTKEEAEKLISWILTLK